MFHLRDGYPPGGCHHRVEIARRLAVEKITFAIGLPGMDNSEIGDETAFHKVAFTVELADFLTFCDQCPDTGFGEKRRYSGAAGSDSFREGPLRIELNLEFSLKIKVREKLVLSDIG